MDNSDSSQDSGPDVDVPVSGNKIINLQRFSSGQTLSPIRQAEAYWSALRVGHSIPRRADVDPRGLENLLHCSFVIESVAPGVARFRLAGRAIAEVTGMEVRGMPITALFTPASRSAISSALSEVFDTPAIVEMNLSGEPRLSRMRFEARMILLPLKDDFDRVTRALGVLVADDRREPVPARFELTGKMVRPVSGLHYRDAEQRRRAMVPNAGMSEPVAAFDTGIPYLRLVKNGD